MNKYLVIGQGSMGKRRVRCLMELGVKPEDIIVTDIRKDRCSESIDQYGVLGVDNPYEVDFSQIKAVIVSLPPDKHEIGVKVAVKNKKPVFVEASVVLDEVLRIKNDSEGLFVAPSCTFVFHPMIKAATQIIKSGALGKICNFSYHSGQFLPDWHPWENVNDFYVSNRITGGAREIVPYELTWITHSIGLPNTIKGYFRKTGNIGCNIEDSYVACLDYGDYVGSFLVDVVSRYPARNLIINFEKGQIQWRWDKKQLDIFESDTGEWRYIKEDDQIHQEGYSSMIGENMYIEEIDAFLKGIENSAAYPNTLDDDIRVLRLLKEIEDSDGGFEKRI